MLRRVAAMLRRLINPGPRYVFVLRTQDGEQVTVICRAHHLDRYIDAVRAVEVVGYEL